VRVRAHGQTFPCRLGAPLSAGRHDDALIELHADAERTAAGQLACLYAQDVVVGHGTICV
jgi:tRNA U34 2-thiouridine synthase MnmA/TrmU